MLIDDLVMRQDDRALHRVPEFPNVPRPRVSDQSFPRFFAEANGFALKLGAVKRQERIGESQQISCAFAQRRDSDRNHVEPIVEIFPEAAVTD